MTQTQPGRWGEGPQLDGRQLWSALALPHMSKHMPKQVLL